MPNPDRLQRGTRRDACGLALAMLVLCAHGAHAQVVHAPVGGRAIALAEFGVACGAASEGWSVDAGGGAVVPPRREEAIGQAVPLRVAPTLAECSKSTKTLTLIATGRWPSFDPNSVVFWPDDGRLEARGRRMRGVSIAWQSGERSGVDRCTDSRGKEGAPEFCIWAVGRDASADPAVTTFSWLPAGAQPGASVFYDADARRVPQSSFALLPARFVITRLIAPDATVDLASGQGQVPLLHPEVVASAECRALECGMSDGELIVRGASRLVNAVELKLRLRPHVYLLKEEVYDTETTAKLPVSHCPMAIVSGPPIRGNDDAAVVVRLDRRCAGDITSVRFVSDENALKELRTGSDTEAVYVLLRLGNISDDNLTITALQGAAGIALAVAHVATRSAPQVRASIELPGFPNLAFIPNNRPALVHVSPAGEGQRFALLPIEGVYSVSHDGETAMVRGEINAAGLASLRFGVRARDLPAGLADADLAVITDPLQRSIGEASIPAPIGTSVLGPRPLIDVLCGGGRFGVQRIVPGQTDQLPFALRDTCRVIFHRERLPPEYGTQKLNFEIEVFSAYGGLKPEGRVSEMLTFRAGPEPRIAWIRGVTEEFDRVVVRVSHHADEAHYIGASEIRTGAPAAQWSVILGTGNFRLYATSTIPAGLYRVSDAEHSGVLSLNFGVVSRLTWLDREGQEGILGLEGGILVKSIGNALSKTNTALSQVGVGLVLGVGLSIPITTRSSIAQASIDLHLWGEMDVSADSDDGRFGIVFGPSISVGNVGTNL